ncbi:Ig-like domain (group 3) [Ruminococcus sp. YE71]|uniref:immunoglobulin-like domain-containing protein n=1 Tax=unclassified Ruminococcus TaxID=2608920 RepID=UPI00088ABE87|nr:MULTISPECIES: immunoglobulin-like domain-containing protein [unclassified Ruminococcus]SDA27736.1 Ig-like domain (group 3) [Ruminococcus sp. YE78]SFW46030.1 Ig-like domain (group 3) [Ruminococcus sp. YE71]
MRYLRIGVVLLFIAALALYVLTLINELKRDHTPPVINSVSDVVELSVKDDESKLLEGLTASDDVDGDLTDNIILSNLSHFTEKGVCKANYVVFDKAHNSAFYTRTVRYTDYTSPRFEIDQPLSYRLGSNVRFADSVRAVDSIDGDITQSIKIASANISNFSEGVYPVRLEVTNRFGDKATADIMVVVSAREYQQTLALKDYIVYIKKDSEFDPFKEITGTTAVDGDGNKAQLKDIQINGSVDTSTPGCYSLVYSYKKKEVFGSSEVFLTIVVEGD